VTNVHILTVLRPVQKHVYLLSIAYNSATTLRGLEIELKVNFVVFVGGNTVTDSNILLLYTFHRK
jgi:hypothetical protein